MVNRELPRSFRDYVHRVGRTGRNNKTGLAISLVTQFDLMILENIQNKTDQALEEITLDENKVMRNATDVIKIRKRVEIFMSEKGLSKRFDEKKIIQ